MSYRDDNPYGDDGFVPTYKSVSPDDINKNVETPSRKGNVLKVVAPLVFVLLYALSTVYINVYGRLKVADHLGENCDGKCISKLHREDKLRMWFILVTSGINALLAGALFVKMNKSPDNGFEKMLLVIIGLYSVITILTYKTYSHSRILGENIKDVKSRDMYANVLTILNPVLYVVLLFVGGRSMGVKVNLFGKKRPVNQPRYSAQSMGYNQ